MKPYQRRKASGFTMVEMLAVIAIIVILAALVVGGMGLVNDRQAREKAKVQIALLSKSLDEYKLTHGEYPKGGSGGPNESNILYKALYWDTDDNGSGVDTDLEQPIYLSELDPNSNKQGWIEGTGSSAKILDPWGNEYRYRSGKLSDGSENTEARNVDFDLWSVGKDGKTTTGSGETEDTKDDIWNVN